MQSQQSTWQSVLDGFKQDDDLLKEEPDFAMKLAELEKYKAGELKKNDRSNKPTI
jgi:hypothetical protein